LFIFLVLIFIEICPKFLLFLKNKKKNNLNYYNLLINIREINKRTNLGNMYFENTYIIITSSIKAKVT